MFSCKVYKRGTHFKLNPEEVLELIFADQSDDEMGKLDDDDINVLGDALGKNCEAVVIDMDPGVGLSENGCPQMDGQAWCHQDYQLRKCPAGETGVKTAKKCITES